MTAGQRATVRTGVWFRLLTRLGVDVRPGEGVPALLLFLYFFLIITFQYASKSVRQAEYIDKLGAEALPLVYFLVAVCSLPVLLVYARFVDRRAKHHLIAATSVLVAASLAAFWWLFKLPDQWVPTVFYVWISIIYVLNVSQFWSYANHVFDARQAKRLFGFIGAGGLLGGVAGGQVAALATRVVGTHFSLLLAAGLLMAVAGLIYLIHHIKPIEGGTTEGTPAWARVEEAKGGFRAIKVSRHLQLVAGTMLLTVIVAQVVDVQFSSAVERSTTTLDQRTEFFGNFYSIMGISAFLFQLMFTARIHRLLGIGFALRVLPVTMAFGTGAVLFAAAAMPILLLPAALSLKVAENGIRYSLDQATRELLFLPVPSRARLKAKIVIDVFVQRFGKGAAAVLLLPVFLGFMPAMQAGWISFALIAAWLVVTVLMRRQYVSSFRAALRSAPRTLTDVAPVEEDAETKRILVQCLESGSEADKLGALEWISTNAVGIEDGVLLGLAREDPSVAVRRSALGILLTGPEVEMPPELMADLEAEGHSALVSAIDMLVEEDADVGRDRLEALLDKAGDTTRLSVVAFTVRRLGPEFEPFAQRVFENLLAPTAPTHARQAAARAVALLPADSGVHRFTTSLLDDSDPEVAAAAVETAGVARRIDLLPRLVDLLGRPRLRGPVRRAIRMFGESVVAPLGQALEDNGKPAAVRRQVANVLAEMGTPKAIDSLTRGLEDGDRDVRARCLSALRRLRRHRPDLRPLSGNRLLDALVDQARQRDGLLLASAALEEDPGPGGRAEAWLRETLREELTRVSERIFTLLALEYSIPDMHRSWMAVRDGSAAERTMAAEFLDNLLPNPLKKLVLPLLETTGPGSKRELSRDQAVRMLVDWPDPWIAACAWHAVRDTDLAGLEEGARRDARSEHTALREEALAFLGDRTAGRPDPRAVERE